MLDDRLVQRDVFGQDVFVIVSVYFGGRGKNQLELFLFLELQDISRSDDVRHPQRIVVFLTVDATEFRRQVVHKIIILFECALQLPVGGNIGSVILLFRLMLQVQAPHFVTPAKKFFLQGSAQRSQRSHHAGYQDLRHQNHLY